MLIKIFWKCLDTSREIYAIRKSGTKIMGFTFPIALEEHNDLPHWTYHSDTNRNPKIHHRSRSGKILKFMTLEADYLQPFQNFQGIVWSAPGFGAPFNLCHAINIKGHPEEAQRNITFIVKESEIDWTHYLNILLIERADYSRLSKFAIDQINNGYEVMESQTISDGNDPNILIVFSKNRN